MMGRREADVNHKRRVGVHRKDTDLHYVECYIKNNNGSYHHFKRKKIVERNGKVIEVVELRDLHTLCRI